MIIRDARKGDLPAIVELVRGMYTCEGRGHLVQLDEEILREALFGGSLQVAVAEADEQLVGYALCFPSFSALKGQWGLNMRDLFVLEEWRGKGIGSQLFTYLKERSGTFVEWLVYDWNDAAKRFYAREGGKPYRDLEPWCT